MRLSKRLKRLRAQLRLVMGCDPDRSYGRAHEYASRVYNMEREQRRAERERRSAQ